MLSALPLQNWRFRPTGPPAGPAAVTAAFAEGAELAAHVPGNVHDDLLAHGLIEDPYLGRNEIEAAWIGRQDWRYSAVLPDLPDRPAAHSRIDLVADGLDTWARLALDGHEVARTLDQHRSYRWDVTGLARSGAELTVDFESVYAAAARVEAALGTYPAAYDEPFQYVRKMASNFGWDWGPTVVTAGVWRDLRLELWDTARLAQVRPRAQLDSPAGQVGSVLVEVAWERVPELADQPLRVAAVLLDPAGRTVARAERTTGLSQLQLTLEAGPVQRWWPHDLGGQPLYRVEVELSLGSRRLDAWSGRIGFRHVALVAEPDSIGRSFGFQVAGRPVFARGFNWIPGDLLVTRLKPEDYRDRLADAKAAGANLIRIWGGGLFESDAFYQACDELGLMVWQDCLFACAAYPESDDLAAQIEAETRDNVIRLMPHPSLVLWNGCNENIWGQQDWNWQPILGDRGWGARYYFDLLPRVMAELDPDRPYWPGSPYSGDRTVHPNHPDFGCHHSWVVWNQTAYADYADSAPRFVSEFGWCGPAAWSTLAQAVGPEHLDPSDPVLLWHYKAENGPAKLRRGLSDSFHQPADFDTWHYLTSLQQARATQFGLDHWRSSWPRCQGALVWQLNDCWPVISWAAVDSAGLRKPVWYAIKQSFAPRLALLGSAQSGYQLKLVNNSEQTWSARPLVRRVGLDGVERAAWSDLVQVPAGQVQVIDLPLGLVAGPEPGSGLADDESLVVDAQADRIDPASRRVLARPERQLQLVAPAYRVETAPVASDRGDPASPTGTASLVRVTASSLVRDLILQADRLGGRSETGPVTLLPGESYEWLVTGLERPLEPADLAGPVLMDAATAELSARQNQG